MCRWRSCSTPCPSATARVLPASWVCGLTPARRRQIACRQRSCHGLDMVVHRTCGDQRPGQHRGEDQAWPSHRQYRCADPTDAGGQRDDGYRNAQSSAAPRCVGVGFAVEASIHRGNHRADPRHGMSDPGVDRLRPAEDRIKSQCEQHDAGSAHIVHVLVPTGRHIGQAWPTDKPARSNMQAHIGCALASIDRANQLHLVSPRRFSFGGSKGNAVRDRSWNRSRFRGCPRNCKRRAFRQLPLGSNPGRRRKAATREPGDLPPVVVTREHIGRGVLVVAELRPDDWAVGRLRSR